MKNKSKSVILLIILISAIFTYPVFAQDIQVNARGAVLMDASTGRILFEQDAHNKVYPASVTKIMTLLITMENLDRSIISLDDTVTISENAASMGGSQLYMEAGETKTVEQLLKAITVASGNDASVAIAEHIGGSEELFVEMMNQRAKELGMKDTHFVNSNGLHDEEHYTSAYDVGIMSRELLKHKKIFDFTTIWMEDIQVGKEGRFKTFTMVNSNKLLRRYDGVDGLKTGYTSAAKHCLSATAKKGSLRLISVVMGSPTSEIRFKESSNLLNFGFARYASVPIAKEDDVINRLKVSKGEEEYVDVKPGEDVNVLVMKGQENTLERDVKMPEFIKAPVKEGQKVGELIINQEGKMIQKIDLIAGKTIEKTGLFRTLWKTVVGWLVRKE